MTGMKEKSGKRSTAAKVREKRPGQQGMLRRPGKRERGSYFGSAPGKALFNGGRWKKERMRGAVQNQKKNLPVRLLLCSYGPKKNRKNTGGNLSRRHKRTDPVSRSTWILNRAKG